jgi:hypothetical protein
MNRSVPFTRRADTSHAWISGGIAAAAILLTVLFGAYVSYLTPWWIAALADLQTKASDSPSVENAPARYQAPASHGRKFIHSTAGLLE